MSVVDRRLLRGAAGAVTAGAMVLSLAGVADASTSAAKQYKSAVAPFNKLLSQDKAPSTSAIAHACADIEKKLSSDHWPKKARKDVKALVKDLKAEEPIFEAAAKSSNLKPTKKQKATTRKFLAQITKVRHDLGLAPNGNGM